VASPDLFYLIQGFDKIGRGTDERVVTMPRNILMIDDDEGYLAAAGCLLGAAGYDVSTAQSADEAREVLKSQTPDLILLDIIMPAKDGLTFAGELANDQSVADIPVVLVTASADSAGRTLYAFEQGDGLTVADVLPKSEAHKHLVDCVGSVLGDRHETTA
jgi:CheY-like chemotaxis protein